MCMNKTKLIEDNIKLVYHCVYKYFPTYRNDEDLMQVGMLGLCRAAETWDGTSSKFSTYACTCIVNQIRMELRDRSRTIPHLSLDYEFGDDDNNPYDIVANEDVDFILNIQFESFVEKLTPQEKEIVNYFSSGMNQTEIANQISMSNSYVSKVIRNIRAKWRKYNGEN